MTNYYLVGSNQYAAITDESPRNFAGVLFIGKSGLTPDSVTEQVYTLQAIQRMEKRERRDVPNRWLIAFGEEPKRKRKPKPVTPPAPGPSLLEVLAPIARRRPRPVPKRLLPYQRLSRVLSSLGVADTEPYYSVGNECWYVDADNGVSFEFDKRGNYIGARG